MIGPFRGKYVFLSNFYRLTGEPIIYHGISYPTVEHAYQAQKTLDVNDRLAISRLPTPGEAKRYGRKIKKLRPGWDAMRIDIMRDLLKVKFSNPYLRSLLIGTGDQELVEENDWRDHFWGVCNGVGENHLGKLLMEIRKDL